MGTKHTVTGEVYKCFSKIWPPKNGKPGNTTYSLKLEGNPIYYRTPRGAQKGSDGDPLTEFSNPGTQVSFEAEYIDEKSAQIIAGTVKKVEAATASVAGAASATGGGSPAYSGGGQTGASRDASIQYQSSRKDAIAFVDVATRLGAVTLPAKAAAKLEAVEALVDHYTSLFYQDIGSLGAIARANGTAGQEETVAPAGGEEE